MGRRIHILTAKRELRQRIHLISALTGLWQARGDMVSFGDVPPAGCDVIIVHTDYSTVPAQALAGLDRSVPVINAAALDIRKSTISQMLLSKADDWDGQVIVKTNANAHAAEEYAYHGLDLMRLAKIMAGRVLPWQKLGELPFRTYPILDSMSDVPDWVWAHEGLVVDRFMPEREGSNYVLRLWMFFGDKEYCMKVTSEEPIVKARKLVSVELLDKVPDEVRAVRAKHGLDFGKIDFVEHDGQALVFDVNKTPTVFLNKAGKPGPYVRSLADGLDGYLK